MSHFTIQFSIRDILWTTLVAAIAISWWMDRKASADSSAELRAKLSRMSIEMVKLEQDVRRLGYPTPMPPTLPNSPPSRFAPIKSQAATR